MPEIDWSHELAEQVDWLWREQIRPRLSGLDDEEYFWEPVDGCWNIRPRGTSSAPVSAGSGPFTIDFAFPPPEPEPVTTIAWRLAHVIVGVLGMRNASHFAGPAFDYNDFGYAGTADEALAQLDDVYAAWIKGVRGLGPDGLARACGEYGFEEFSMAALVLHINKEVIHHLAEVALLRDLYRAR